MTKTITSVIDDTLSQIREHGLKESSVTDYQKSLFQPILKYFIQKGCECYDRGLLEEFLSYHDARRKNGEISHSYFSRFQKAAHLLISTAETGQTDFSMRSKTGAYFPTAEHLALINKILDSAGYKGTARRDLLSPIKHFFCYIEGSGIDAGQITDRDILLFFNEASIINSFSMGRVLRALKLITSYLKENSICSLDLDYSMMGVKRGRDRCIAPYSPDEVNSVLSVIDRSSEIGARDYAIILLALGTGLRGCDIASLRKDEIDWHGCSVSIIQKKTGNSLHLPLGGEIMNAIADYILKFRPESAEPYVFLTTDRPPRMLNRCALYKRLGKYKSLAGVAPRERQGFHSLRRAFATGLSASGVDISTISSLMGHRGIDEDRPYLSYNDGQMAFVAMGCSSVPFSGKYYSDCNSAQMCTGDGRNDVL